MKKIRRFLKLRYLLLAVILWFLLRGTLNYTGFCWAEKRWLSDEERIDIAIQEIISQKTAWIPDVMNGAKEYEVIPYKSITDFKEQNPNCCQVLTFTHDLSAVILDGLSRKVVKIIYEIEYVKDSKTYKFIPNSNNTEWGFYFQNSCGAEYNIFAYKLGLF